MGDPEVIMIDEPTEGLSPQMTTRVAELLNEISSRGFYITCRTKTRYCYED